MKKAKYILLVLIITTPDLLSAQKAETAPGFLEQYQVEIVLGLAVIVCLTALVAMYTLLVAMKTLLRMKLREGGVEEKKVLIKAKAGEEKVGFWSRFWNRLNESVPVAKEQTVATEHEYDGIRELDNRLPSWWLYGFYFTILFGAAYLINYHVIRTGPNQQEEFETAMKKAEAEVQLYLASRGSLIDESTVELVTASADIGAGEEIYQANCAVCHAQDGGGGVGPNFTDPYWLHGGDIKSIFKIIKYGIPEKGMIAWEAQLSPEKMQQVASFIYTLQGTTPDNPKEPQGEYIERTMGEEDSKSDSTTTDPA